MTILQDLIQKGVLVSPELMEKDVDEDVVKDIVEFFGDDLDRLDEEIIEKFKGKDKNVIVKKNYEKEPKERTFQDFVSVFNLRFKTLRNILTNRQELQSPTTLRRVKDKDDRSDVEIIGMVKDKGMSKNDHVILEVEDPTGTVTTIIRKTDEQKELWEEAKNLVLDEVIGVTGTWLSGAVFADQILYPDVPYSKELKKQKDDEYMVFIGDTHFGSKHFMEDEWKKFIRWLRGETGNERQRKLAKKVKYIMFTGDLIEGAGVYPGQDEDLKVEDIKSQYDEGAYWLKQVPDRIQMVTTTGNHDAGRLAEPQMAPLKEYAESLYDIPNLTLVSNPATVNVGRKDDFPGFDVLLYHGGSLIYYADNIPKIRNNGGQKQSGELMKELLKRRHLAPTHGSTLYLPDAEEDHLLIEEVPDFFVTGHIHRASMDDYKGVTMINASCWTETTQDQIKRGLEPQPGRVPIVNLRTRKKGMMNFLTREQKEKEKLKTQKAQEA